MTKAVAIVSSIIAMALGLFVCITFKAICIVAGILQICSAFIVIVFEAPCCCQCLDFINQIGNFSDNRPHWQKAIGYGIIALLPMFFCFEMSTVFGSGLLFVTATLYGIMALGKKADRETMMKRATEGESEEILLDNIEPTGVHKVSTITIQSLLCKETLWTPCIFKDISLGVHKVSTITIQGLLCKETLYGHLYF
ncbi:unnamed protein product [Owenia fusiformis]|uniref:Calcium channel flower n=1 Tax=Owenia fusiformis TaxID=6347 RepID=A0A8S4P2Y4_OWEFU|nr:unnamed protein product [Owenia fusiformis]